MFKDFMIQFNRTYRNPTEQRRRFGIFTRSLFAARRLQETELGTGQYGVTRFSDWTGGERPTPSTSERRTPPPAAVHPSLPPPLSHRPVLPRWASPLSPQGEKCQSCWAFAAVANIESLWNIHFHQPRNLSVQEVLDCSWCGAGCKGGYVWDAFTTVLHKRTTFGFPLVEIAAHVATKGPITVTLNSAAMKPLVKSCSPDQVDHVALLVGYGDGEWGWAVQGLGFGRYWVIKNSWGEAWGEEGYYRLYRGRNACGITTFPVTAIVHRIGAPGHEVHCPP
uniref:Cathepsin W n=1 Tax=Chelydra serpentina TaxID=8475 RepID=A0A8C3SHX8_CHESE